MARSIRQSRRLRERLGLLAATTALFALSSASRATVLRSQSIQSLTRSADMVVRAKVVSATSLWRGSRIYTRVSVQVAERWFCGPSPIIRSSSCRAKQLDIWTLGGKVGRVEQKVFGAPRLRKGSDLVLFLSKRKGGLFVTGMAQGAFLLQKRGATTWAVRRLGGVRWKGRPPAPRMPLHRLEALVRKALQSRRGPRP